MNDMSANIYVPKLNRSAWIKGFMLEGFNRIVQKKIKSHTKVMKFALHIHKHLIKEFREKIWIPRCNKYKEWLDQKHITYKEYCKNMKRNNSRTHCTHKVTDLQQISTDHK